MNPSGSGMHQSPHMPQYSNASPNMPLQQQQQQQQQQSRLHYLGGGPSSPLNHHQQLQNRVSPLNFQQQQAVQQREASPLAQQPQQPRESSHPNGQQAHQRQSPAHRHVQQPQAQSRGQIHLNAHYQQQQQRQQQVLRQAHSVAGAYARPGPSGQRGRQNDDAVQQNDRPRQERTVALCRPGPHEQLANNMFEFQRNQEFTDITITTAGNSTFKCHKAVLAASSGYFRRTLRNIVDLNCDHPVIALTQVCPEVFTVLIEIMYTGRVLCPISLVTRVGEAARLLEIDDVMYENSSQNLPSSMINPPLTPRNISPAIVDANNDQNPPVPAAAAPGVAAGPLANPMLAHFYNQLAQQQQQQQQQPQQVVSNANNANSNEDVKEIDDDEDDQPLVVDEQEPMEEDKHSGKSKMSNLLEAAEAAAMALSSRQANKAESAKDSMELETPKAEKKEPNMENASNTVSRHKSRKGLPKKMLISGSFSDGVAAYSSSPSTLAATSSSSSEGSPEALMRASATQEQQQNAQKPLSPVAEERPAPRQSEEEEADDELDEEQNHINQSQLNAYFQASANDESEDTLTQEERARTILQNYLDLQSRIKGQQQYHHPTQTISPPTMVLPGSCGLQALAAASQAGPSGLQGVGSGIGSLIAAAGDGMDFSQGPSQSHRGRARKGNARLARDENGEVIIGNNGKPMVECEICNKQLTDPSSLYRHKKTHTGEKKHMCPICEKRFIQRYNMKQHVTTHADQVIDPMVLQTMEDDLREALIKRIQDRNNRN